MRLHPGYQLALVIACLSTLVTAQSGADSIQLVVPTGPIQRGANVTVGFSDPGSQSNDDKFVATKNCAYGSDGTAESNCTSPSYSTFSSESLSINRTTGEWQLPTEKTCVTSAQIGGGATYGFGYNTGNWSLGNSTIIFERILLYGSNGTIAEPNPSMPNNGLYCIYPPFTSEIVQANATIEIVEPASSSQTQSQQVQSTTSTAPFSTTVPRPSGAAAGRFGFSGILAASAILLIGLTL